MDKGYCEVKCIFDIMLGEFGDWVVILVSCCDVFVFLQQFLYILVQGVNFWCELGVVWLYSFDVGNFLDDIFNFWWDIMCG